MKLVPGDLEQVGVLGGDQRAHEVIGRGLDGLEIVLGVVALVEDQGDVFDALDELLAPGHEGVGQPGEGGGVGLIARVRVMEQRHVEVGGDEQGQSHDAQRRAALLALAPLSQGGPRIEGVDKREEVGRVEQQALEIEMELLDEVRRQVRLDALDHRAGGFRCRPGAAGRSCRTTAPPWPCYREPRTG